MQCVTIATQATQVLYEWFVLCLSTEFTFPRELPRGSVESMETWQVEQRESQSAEPQICMDLHGSKDEFMRENAAKARGVCHKSRSMPSIPPPGVSSRSPESGRKTK